MARAHAHLLTAIWSDPDWVALSQGAQHTYLLLLSQPKLTMIGLLDYLPSRWARLAADTTPASVGASVDELEASRFVIVDPHTDELLIRTLVRHDATASKIANQRWLAGVWSAWHSIESQPLRTAAATEIPPAVWNSPKVQPPAEAQTCRSAQKLLPERSTRTNRQNVPQSPVTTTSVEPKPAGLSRPREASPAAAVDNPPADVLDQALDLLVDREIARNPTRGPSIERHRAGIRRGKARDHTPAAHRHLGEQPHLTPAQLADLLEPPPLPARPTNKLATVYNDQQAAERARAEENMRKLDHRAPDPTRNVAAIERIRSERRLPSTNGASPDPPSQPPWDEGHRGRGEADRWQRIDRRFPRFGTGAAPAAGEVIYVGITDNLFSRRAWRPPYNKAGNPNHKGSR